MNLVKIFFIFLIVFNLPASLFAATKSTKTKETPTKIRSDIIDIKRKSQLITFINNVVVEKEDSSLLAQKMIVIYEENSQNKSEIKKIEAFDNVKIFSRDFVASSDYGYFDPKKSIFVLENDVIVNNGTSIASGKKFIYDIKTKKGNFVGQSQEASINKNARKKRVVVVIGNDIVNQTKSKNSKKDE